MLEKIISKLLIATLPFFPMACGDSNNLQPDQDIEVQYFLKQGPAHPEYGEDVVLAFLIRNNGTIHQNIRYILDFGDGIMLDEQVGLNPGESQIIMRKHQYNSPGQYNPRITTDPYDVIEEVDETNNERDISLVVL